MIYLASPYSHPDPAVREQRFRAACRMAGELMRQGVRVFSPIAHTHPIALEGDLPLGWDFWEQFDREMIAACEAVVVLTLDGWRESKGVTAEIAIAKELGIPVSTCDMADNEMIDLAQAFIDDITAV